MPVPRQTRSIAGPPSQSYWRSHACFAFASAVGMLAAICWLVPTASADSATARHAPAPEQGRADFLGEAASRETQDVANWIVSSGDNLGLPFIIIDKLNARVFLFDSQYRLRGATSALLGLANGDESVPGIGHRRLATIRPEERTTPAGRFQASLGHDFEQDILWIDYEASVSLHRVIVGKPSERRHARLASATPLDNRISYGCINVPELFYNRIVAPAFKGTVGIVYILPETKPIEAIFAMHTRRAPLPANVAPPTQTISPQAMSAN